MKKLVLILVLFGGYFLAPATGFAETEGGQSSKWVKVYFDNSISSFDCDQNKVTAKLGREVPYFDSEKNVWAVGFYYSGQTMSFVVDRESCISFEEKIKKASSSCGVRADFRVFGAQILEMRNFEKLSPGTFCS